MRELLWWSIPGLVVAGPLHLFLDGWAAAPAWPLWLVVAPVFGFVLHQAVRSQFEGSQDGFRNPQRGGLAVIIERGELGQRPDRGDIAYQVYEVVFYQRPDWEAIRGHAHRCWEYIFMFRSTALGCAVGVAFALVSVPTAPGRGLLYVLALPIAAIVLWSKSDQTLAALQSFDRALVLAHWPLYEAVLRDVCGPQSG